MDFTNMPLEELRRKIATESGPAGSGDSLSELVVAYLTRALPGRSPYAISTTLGEVAAAAIFEDADMTVESDSVLDELCFGIACWVYERAVADCAAMLNVPAAQLEEALQRWSDIGTITDAPPIYDSEALRRAVERAANGETD